MALDSVKCWGSIRTSQIPASRSRQWSATKSASSASWFIVSRSIRAPPGAAVAAQMIEHALGHVGAAVEPIEHAQARRRQSRGVHEPPEERRRLLTTAELEERLDREGGVTDPAVAVIPVALAADRLRQRRGRRRRDGAGWREDEQLQRQRAPHDGIAPGASVRELPRPPLPERRGGVEPSFDVGAWGGDERLVAGGDHAQEGPMSGRHLEAPAHAAVANLRSSRVPAPKRDAVGAVAGHRNLAAA